MIAAQSSSAKIGLEIGCQFGGCIDSHGQADDNASLILARLDSRKVRPSYNLNNMLGDLNDRSADEHAIDIGRIHIRRVSRENTHFVTLASRIGLRGYITATLAAHTQHKSRSLTIKSIPHCGSQPCDLGGM